MAAKVFPFAGGATAAAAAIAAFLVVSSLLHPVAGEIKSLSISDDTRDAILFEKFGFTLRGTVAISLSSASAAVDNPQALGFFLLSDESLFQAIYDSQEQPAYADDPNPNPNPNPIPNCVLSSPYVRPLFTFADLGAGGSYNNTFQITHADEYSLFFANCAPGSAVTMNVHTEMYNTKPDGSRDYLSVGQRPVPAIYAAFAVAYFAFLAGWLYVIFVRDRLSTHQIHHVMSCLLLTRCIYLVSAAEDQHYIRTAGSPHGWDVPFYLFQLVKGVLLFAVIALIGTGWSFLKPFLQDREKKVLITVIPLQVAANIAAVVLGETGPFLRSYVTWSQLFLLIDVACCCAVLFPVIWSIRSLREASKTDGKAARNLAKLTLFRQFYIVVIGFLYFTRIIVYALKTITSYKFRWVSVLAEEVATLAFYGYMFYTFRPVERNQYLAIDDDDEEAAAAALQEEEFEL